MFSWNFREAPIMVTLACPVCRYCQTEHTGQNIVAQQFKLCAAHRAHFEKLLRDPKTPRLAIECWLTLWRNIRV